MVQIIHLSNGVQIALVKTSHCKSASIGIWVRAGARFEAAQVKGVAHFLEHMVFKGSASYSSRAIKEEIEGRGGTLNAFTSHELTAFYAKVLEKNLPITFDILSDMMLVPLVKLEDLEKERTVILEELKMYNDMPSAKVISNLDSLSWRNNPLGEDIAGKSETVQAIHQDDILDFQRKHYTGRNILVTCTYRNEHAKIVTLVKKKFGKLAQGFENSFLPASFSPGRAIQVERSTFQQTHLALGFPAFNYFHPWRFAAQLIHIILGANMSSRLFESLREREGLAYDVSSQVKLFQDTGAFNIHIGLDEKNIQRALEMILQELVRMQTQRVGAQELRRAQDYFLGNFFMSLEDSLQAMFYAGESICNFGKFYSPRSVEKEILAVTPACIQKVARSLFRFSEMKVSVIVSHDQGLRENIESMVQKFI